MVEIKIGGQKSTAYVHGTTKEICVDLAIAIAAIHQQLKAENNLEAACFRKTMRTVMEPGFPVWHTPIPSVTVDMSKINKK